VRAAEDEWLKDCKIVLLDPIIFAINFLEEYHQLFDAKVDSKARNKVLAAFSASFPTLLEKVVGQQKVDLLLGRVQSEVVQNRLNEIKYGVTGELETGIRAMQAVVEPHLDCVFFKPEVDFGKGDQPFQDTVSKVAKIDISGSKALVQKAADVEDERLRGQLVAMCTIFQAVSKGAQASQLIMQASDREAQQISEASIKVVNGLRVEHRLLGDLRKRFSGGQLEALFEMAAEGETAHIVKLFDGYIDAEKFLDSVVSQIGDILEKFRAAWKRDMNELHDQILES
jgi:hypothetical protein